MYSPGRGDYGCCVTTEADTIGWKWDVHHLATKQVVATGVSSNMIEAQETAKIHLNEVIILSKSGAL
ncbi:hypothetical protein HK25_13335 [Acetobacter sp. DsW_059]|nr:hypothetical protein HK25_13335 [Acetobacter sp. DsW_059]